MEFKNTYITEDRCPFCNETGVFSDIQIDGTDFWVENECPHCNAIWDDVYEAKWMSSCCPECSSPDIESNGGPDADGLDGWVDMQCNACYATWVDEYVYEHSWKR